MKKIHLILVLLILSFTQKETYCQTSQEMEQVFLTMRKFNVAIGTTVNDTIITNGKKIEVRKFIPIGAGLMTYTKNDTLQMNNVITARHVINFFKEHKLKSLFIRPSWADTIKTTEYYGIEVPLISSDGFPYTYLYPEKEIDLGSIIIPGIFLDKIFIEYAKKDANKTFPINSMTIPFLGSQVWICGYPSHVENNFQNQFLYSISTFKPGYITWKPSINMINKDLYHLTLVESNATFGNSGGPVFALTDKVELIGILVGGYEESDTLYLNNKPVIDITTKQAYITKSRAGVSIIEKAEYVKKLVQYVQSEIELYLKNDHKATQTSNKH